MKSFFLRCTGLSLMVILLTACSPSTPTEPAVDVIGTRSMELASLMMTQTVAAYSPTPPPTFTPAPTATATVEPTPMVIEEPRITNGPAACYIKPDTTSVLTSNISDYKVVELLAIGSSGEWYKIMNPYFGTPCWVQKNYLRLDSNMDLSLIPIE